MIRNSKACLIVLLCLFHVCLTAQVPSRRLTLDEVINLAAAQSPEALIAKNQYYNSYWQYRMFRTDFLPRLSLDGSSDFNRTINPVTLPTGEDVFVDRNLSSSSANLSLSQNIGYSGTQVFLNSGIRRIDIISTPASTSFLTTPVVIGFRQPLLAFNAFKWQLKTEPLKFTEAKRQYMEAMEDISIRSINAFFDLYLAQINLDIALKNLANNDTLYKIAQGRYNLGKIGENELLQIELSALNSQTAVTQARLDLQIRTFNLKKFLGLRDNLDITLESPEAPPVVKVDYPIALEQALKNRRRTLQLERQLIEAERDVAQARGDSRFKANLFGTYGLTKTAPELQNSYSNPLDQQQLSFGVQVPIIDWGRARAQVKMAKAAQELVKTNVEQEKMNFEQEVFLAARQYEIQDRQFRGAAKADTIGIKRYELAKQRYYIGKIDITSLNIAVNEKDMARRAYVEALKNYWSYYYLIRKLTLFDFRNNSIIDTKLDIK
jgi:outer membrane protein TolC